jgi:DNA-binding PadR family transcriptional regulator
VPAQYPVLPGLGMSSRQFAVCAILVGGPKSFGRIRDDLKKMGWKTQPNGASVLLRRAERAGLVVSERFDKESKLFRLTKRGLRELKAVNSFNSAVNRLWGNQIEKAIFDQFPAERGTSKAPTKERAATEEEFARIVGAASIQFSRVLRFARILGLRVYDVANARIEAFNSKKSELQLEEKSLTNRPIREQVVRLDEKAKQILRDAIESRRSGLIFLNVAGKAWTTGVLSRNFMLARKRAGLPVEVVMSGRGGNVFKRGRIGEQTTAEV